MSPAPTSRGTIGDRRKQEAIETAFSLIAEKGFEGLRVRDVAEKAGMNIATLHYYFPDKEALIQGVCAYMGQLFVGIPAKEGERDPLLADFLPLGENIREKPALFRVINEFNLRALRDASLREALDAMQAGWTSHLEDLYRTGVAAALYRKEIAPEDAAQVFSAAIRGWSVQFSTGLDQKNPDQFFESLLKPYRR